MSYRRSSLSLLSALALSSVNAYGQETVIGGDDFDGGGDFTSRVFSPGDFSDANGLFLPSSSRFDRFGIVNRETEDVPNPDTSSPFPTLPFALPFDVIDDSADGFPLDNIGVLGTQDTSNVVLLADTNNGNNPNAGGVVNITYEFDISGFTDLGLSVDFAAVGDFEAGGDGVLGDTFGFIYSIDGGSTQSAFTSEVLEDEFYSITLESGETFNRFSNPFFDDPPTGGGPNDLAVAVDADGDPEFLEFTDPVAINGVQLDNDFQTISSEISGIGDVLSLTFVGTTDGALEFFLFDNIVLTGVGDTVVALLGDINLDDAVDVVDLDLFGTSLLSGGTNLDGDLNGDGVVDVVDLDIFGTALLDFSAENSSLALSLSALSVAAVPEPSSLALLTLGGIWAGRRRR